MLQRRALGNRTSWSWRPANTPSFLRVAQREVRTSLCKSYEHCRVSPLVVTHLCSHLHTAARCCSTVDQAASSSPQIIELQRLLKSCGSHKSVSDNPIDQEEPWKSALRVAFNGAVPELPLPLPSQQQPEVMRWALVVALKANAPDDVCSALYAAIRTTDSCASSIRAKPFESGIQHAMARHWLRRCYAVAPSLGGSGPDSHNGWPEAILFVLSALRMLLVDADASAPRKPSSVLLLMESLQLFTALPHFHLSPNSKDDARASNEDALLQWLRAPGRTDLLLQRCLQELLSTSSISWRLQQEAVLIFLSGSTLTARCPAHITMPPTLLARCVTIRGLTTTAREHGDDEDGGLGDGEGGVQRLQRQVHEWSLLTASATGDAAQSWSVPLIQALISPLSDSQSREAAVEMCCGGALAWSVRSVLQLLAGIRDENHVLDRRQWDIASDVVVEWLHKVLLQLASIASVAGVREHQRLAVEEEVWRCVLESVQHGYFAPIGTSDARKRASRDVLREVVLPLFGQQYWRGAAVNVFVEVMGAWGKSKVLRDVFQTIRRQEATQGRQVLEALRGAKEGEGEDAMVELPAYHPTLSLQSCALIFDHCVGEHLEDGENPHMGGEVVRYALVVLRLLESAEPSASLLDGRTLEQWLHWVHTEALPAVNAARERNGMDE